MTVSVSNLCYVTLKYEEVPVRLKQLLKSGRTVESLVQYYLPTLLYSTNADVHAENSYRLDKIPGPKIVSESNDFQIDDKINVPVLVRDKSLYEESFVVGTEARLKLNSLCDARCSCGETPVLDHTVPTPTEKKGARRQLRRRRSRWCCYLHFAAGTKKR